MSIKDIMTELSQEISTPCHRGFWDKDRHGIQPQQFFVWRVVGDSANIQSDNDEEKGANAVRISFFTKNEDNVDTTPQQMVNFAKSKKHKAYIVNFEDYEQDTIFYHKEMECIIFKEE